MRRGRAYEERQAKQWAAAFTVNKRSWAYAALANLALVLCLVVLPYLRGQARVREAYAAYDRFATCLYGDALGGVLRSVPLATEASVFATRAREHRQTLSTECTPRLRAVAPEPALLLLPTLKRAEQAVREATRVVREELRVLDRAPAPGTPLSQRPLRALLQLRAVLALYSDEAGLLEPPPGPTRAASAPATTSLPTPGRIPLYVGADAVLTLWGNDGELHALGLDRTGLSYLRMHTYVDIAARLPRPKLLRDALVRDDRVLLVWGTSKSRCTTLGSCASKSTGLAEAIPPLTDLPTPRWLAAHLFERADRGLAIDGARHISLIADTSGVPERRDFVSPDLTTVSADQADMPPLRPAHAAPIGPSSQSLLLSRAHHTELLSLRRQGEQTVLVRQTANGSATSSSGPRQADDQATTSIGALPWAPSSWLTGCASPAAAGFVFGTSTALVLGALSHEGAVVSAPVFLAVGAPIAADDRSRDRVSRFCVATGMLASVLDDQHALWTVFCPRHGDTCEVQRVAEGVDRHAALQTEQSVLFAYAGAADAPQIHTRSVDLRGVPTGPEQTPSTCWSPRSGMCGAPTLARLGGRVVLAAQDGTDLVALESPDLGHTWQPLHGATAHVPRELVAQTNEVPSWQ